VINAIWYALQQLQVTHKKTLRYPERGPTQRGAYLQELRQFLTTQGSSQVVYLIESGFERTAHRTHGWACRGQQVAGERSGNTQPRMSFLAGKCGKRLVSSSVGEHQCPSGLMPGSNIISSGSCPPPFDPHDG